MPVFSGPFFCLTEKYFPSKPYRLRSSIVRVSARRCFRTGSPIRTSSHDRCLSATKKEIFLRAKFPVFNCSTVRGSFQRREKPNYSALSPWRNATFSCTVGIRVNFPIPSITACSVIHEVSILSSVPSSQLPCIFMDSIPS